MNELSVKCDNLVKNVQDGIINSAEAIEVLKEWYSKLFEEVYGE